MELAHHFSNRLRAFRQFAWLMKKGSCRAA
jgi:hypothetical protein